MDTLSRQEKLSRRVVRMRVEGRVQGVGFRMFVQREAIRYCVDGMVRNRRDGGVEAVFAGTSDAIAAVIDACRNGPRGADVTFLKVLDETLDVPRGFTIAPTA